MTDKNRAPHVIDIDDASGIDQIPDDAVAHDATHFRAIIAARENLEAAEQALRDAVTAARAAGDSWVMIGAALDTSRQNAFQRFGADQPASARRPGRARARRIR